MTASKLIEKIQNGALAAYSHLYGDLEDQKSRYIGALERFIELYGEVDLKKLKAKAAKKEQRKRKRASAGVKGYGYNSSPRLGVIRRASRVDRHHHVVGDLDGSNGTVVR